MEDMKSLLIGVVGGFLVLAITYAFRMYRTKTLKNDIELLDLEIETLDKMKRSSVEMNRASFRGLYALLFLFGLINLIEKSLTYFAIEELTNASKIINISLWFSFSYLAFLWWQRYGMLRDYSKSKDKLLGKKQKKENALSKLVP
ncbi:hypothetical protein [Photobacterium nomapromontoriensis]|uniref:hypothetical protein n=1 Tax=Photobacterium nomapromontoriensis TaxID=2910237 RepID=UPI003D12F173